MGGGGAWIFWLFGLGWVVYMVALALGKTPVGRVRDERDALYSRWLFGGLTAVTGLVFAFSSSSVPGWLLATGLLVSGAAVIQSARRLAPTDPTNRVPDTEIQRATRQFVFDSRPPARGVIEIHPKRGWSIFIAACLIGFSGIIIGVAIGTLGSGEAEAGSWLVVLGMAAFFLVVLIAPAIWWTQRVLRGIPFLRIDEQGLVMGRDARRDAAITWKEVRTYGGSARRQQQRHD